MTLHRLFRARRGLALFVALALLSAPIAVAANPALEARVARIERMLNERSLSDLVLQIQQLQQEVQDLRGQVETQQYLLRRQGGPGPGLSTSPSLSSGPSGSIDDRFGSSRLQGGPSDPMGRINARLPGSGVGALAQPGDSEAQLGSPPNQPQQVSTAPAPASSGGGMLGLPPPETSAGGERDLYRDAFNLLKARDYPAASDAFGEMVNRYPQGQYADNGRYWLGEIGYVTQDYSAAQAEFNRLVTDYPLSSKVPAAMLKLGYVYYEQDQLGEARSVLEEVVQRFPDTTEARLAQGRLDRMQREGG